MIDLLGISIEDLSLADFDSSVVSMRPHRSVRNLRLQFRLKNASARRTVFYVAQLTKVDFSETSRILSLGFVARKDLTASHAFGPCTDVIFPGSTKLITADCPMQIDRYDALLGPVRMDFSGWQILKLAVEAADQPHRPLWEPSGAVSWGTIIEKEYLRSDSL